MTIASAQGLNTMQQLYGTRGKCTETLLSLFLLASSLVFASSAIANSDHEVNDVRRLILQARKAGDSESEIKKAELLYLQALKLCTENMSLERLEILARLVHLQINDHRLSETTPLVKDAIATVKHAQAVKKVSGEQAVWIDDISDAFIFRGERTDKEEIKEFCLERYLDLKFAVASGFDRELGSRASLLSNHYLAQGKYAKALPYLQQNFDFTEKLGLKNPIPLSLAKEVLGGAYCALKQFDRATQAYTDSLAFSRQNGKDPNYDGITLRMLGLVKSQAGDIVSAEKLVNQAKLVHEGIGQKAATQDAWDEYVLGLIALKQSHSKAGSEHFQKSLDLFDAGSSNGTGKIEAASINAGQVLCLRRLIELDSKKTAGAVKAMHQRVYDLISENKDWLLKKNPDPEQYCLLFGRMPEDVDILRSRLALPN